MTRIYTRTGDDGSTGLVGGERVKKSSARIECYGTVDELSSFIGLARASLRDDLPTKVNWQRLDTWLAWVQDALFNLGSELATPPGRLSNAMPRVSATDVLALERAIDETQSDLRPLANFIHPGGSISGAQLHVARTICRRAERLLVKLAESEGGVSPETLTFLNRLSDALFVWARWINARLSAEEHLWSKDAAPPSTLES